MSHFLDLAKLLEQAAFALRTAHAQLASIGSSRATVIDTAQWSVRAGKLFYRLNIKYLEQLTSYTIKELELQKNCGPTTLLEIRDKLKEYGLYLKGERPLESNNG